MKEEMIIPVLNKIKKSNNIYIMPHKGIDLDAFGASLGLYFYLKSIGKHCRVVMSEYQYDLSVEKALNELKHQGLEFERYQEDEEFFDNDLLIVLDCYKKELTDNETVYEKIKNKIIIDHHYSTEDLDNSITSYIYNNASSTCELITEILKEENTIIPGYIYTLLLSGIAVDTSNFTMKVTASTYLMAAYLTNKGADLKEIQFLLKENIEEYFKIQNVIKNIKIVNDVIAISKADDEIYDKEFLAKVSSTLLRFEDIEISFTIGKISDNIVGISARSLGNYDVSKYMRLLNGGGSITDAATQIKDTSIDKVENELLETIKGGK